MCIITIYYVIVWFCSIYFLNACKIIEIETRSLKIQHQVIYLVAKMLSFKICTSPILEDDNSYFQNMSASNENSPLPLNSSYYSTSLKYLILQDFFFLTSIHDVKYLVIFIFIPLMRNFSFHISSSLKCYLNFNVISSIIILYIDSQKVWYIFGTNSILIIYMSHFSSEFGFAFHFLYCDF